jgi:hypothetical protein
MLIKITIALALAIAAMTAVPASVGSSFAQSNPAMDCTRTYWGGSGPC